MSDRPSASRRGSVNNPIPPLERFWAKVEKSDGCWNWTGYTTRGYGRFYTGHKKIEVYAHRYSYELAYGESTAGFMVCHKCDNPRCVRPDHLFLGTQAENLRDMRDKGRQSRGDRAGNALLSDDIVRFIRSSSERRPELAKKFGVSVATIHNVLAGRIWKHVT